MFKKITDKAKELKDKVDISHAVETTKQLASNGFEASKAKAADISQTITATKQSASDKIDAGKSKANDFLEQNWPKIEGVLVGTLLTVAEEKLKDDSALEAVLDKAYELLPIAIRLVLPRTKFVEFGMKRRDPLLLKLQEQKAKKESASEISDMETLMESVDFEHPDSDEKA